MAADGKVQEHFPERLRQAAKTNELILLSILLFWEDLGRFGTKKKPVKNYRLLNVWRSGRTSNNDCKQLNCC